MTEEVVSQAEVGKRLQKTKQKKTEVEKRNTRIILEKESWLSKMEKSFRKKKYAFKKRKTYCIENVLLGNGL